MSKIKYDANQDYQVDALNSIIDLLDGALAGTPTVTTITDSSEAKIIPLETNILGNSLAISDEKLLENLNAVQERNDLPLSPSLESREFSIEMETGTGKTYVYTSAIHKLHADYGLTKFIIIVPSIAIKEGTYNSILEMNDHFTAQYNQKLSPFIYVRTKLDQVKEFIGDSEIQVMIMTIGSFNKKGKNVWYQEKEELSYSKPVELVKRTRPVVIIDEPQSVEGGVYGKGREGLDELDALFTIRLSATLPDKDSCQLIYELNPIDAYNLELVKGIEVDSPELSGETSAYIELIDVVIGKGKELPRAKVRLNKKNDEGITTCEEIISKGQDLANLTKIKSYSTVKIERVSKRKGRPPMLALSLGNGEKISLNPGQSVGGIDENTMVRAMMKKIIQNHLDNENDLRGKNIKVLSLFFIDRVSKYRIYDESGQVRDDAEYVVMFEELMEGFAKESEYEELFIDSDTGNSIDIKDMHEGYFSIDPKGKMVDTSLTNKEGKANASMAFNLIIKRKKELIDPDNPVRFIFSHSALNEGWDVPNIFQISVLRDIKSTMTKRQTIGRGMRLCRKKNGDEFERIRDPNINILKVTAKQTFEKWAAELQHEYERTGITFGKITKKVFGSELVEDLKKKGHLDSEGKPTDTFESYVNSEQFDAKGGG
ncbi:MAG TPA: DEAD/DEAH box helicase [Candidatus Poseidoniales archaeon]|nr:DEAD/DEAH box helicase [Candidatus Poseidoniales archaeon]